MASCCGNGFAHREGEGFVEVNSTLIVYLCSTVQSASIRTVALFFRCVGSLLQHIGFEMTVGLSDNLRLKIASILSMNLLLLVQRPQLLVT